MRKILTFVAAICCTMFLSVNSVMALTPFGDGVKIEIAGVDAGAANPLDILGDGTVAYDAAGHILYLNGADIEADKVSGHLAGIYIDAGSLTDEFFIDVFSGNNIEATSVPAIWFKGGVALSIVGLDNSNHLQARTQGAEDVYAVLCADDELLGDPKPLRVQNISFTASNGMSGAGGVYPAIYAAFYNFTNCKLEVETFGAIDPIIVDDDSKNVLSYVVLMDNSYSPYSIIEGIPFTTLFPVWVDDVPLCDGLSTNVDGFYELTSWNFSHIKSGSIAYDPATYTVHLSGDFELEATTESGCALVVGEGFADEFTVVVDGSYSWYDVKINAVGAYANGLRVRSNTVFDINGHNVQIYSQNQDAIELDGANLTLKNSGADVQELTIIADKGAGITGGGDLTIDHCKTTITSKGDVCVVGNIIEVAVAITDPSAYKVNGGQIDDLSTAMIAQDATVGFDLSMRKLTVDIYPKAAAGSVELKDGKGKVQPLPYEYSADEDVTLTATAATGWDFFRWDDILSEENPRTVSLDKNYNKSIVAKFSRRIESDATYYTISSWGTITEVEPKLRASGAVIGDLSIPSGNELRRAVFVDGKIFFTQDDDTYSNVSLSVATFDGTTIGTPTELFAMQNVYYPISAMAYSKTDEVIYAIGYKQADYKEVLLEIALADGAITEVVDMDPGLYTGNFRDIAINAAGDIFALVDNGSVGLYSIDKTTGDATWIGAIDGVYMSSYFDTNLTFDPVTDELFLVGGMPTNIMLVDPATANVDWIAESMTTSPAFFTIGGGAPKPKHTITVEVAAGDESKGDVNINGGGKSGEFAEGSSVTLNAIANSGFAFKEWNDGNTDEIRTVKVGTTDATYTAYFKEDLTPTHTITVEVAKGQEAMGDVDINGGAKSGDFAEGKKITLNAKPNSGYKFVKWNDENTDASRSFTVGKEDKTFIASFEDAPMPTGYPVTIADVTLNEEKAMLVAGTDLTGILKAGFISYDPATNTLTLNNVELELTDPTIAAILIDGDAAKAKVNIEIVGTCKITASGVGIYLLNSSMITLSGEGKLDIKAANGIVLDEANLTLNGIALNVDATGNGIVGQNNTEKLIVNGAHISVKGTAGSICGLGDMERNYCSFQSGYKFENNQVEKGGSLATDAVVLDVWPMLTVSPVDKGSANFTLKSKNTGDTFQNKGWFEKDDEVTITPEEADNFVFARWMDDSDWKDKDLRIKETRKITKSDKDESLSALFYFEPESSNDWFGVNNDEFIKFSLGDHAAKVARASNSLSDVKGGDYDGENWIFIEDATVNYFEFNGTLKDGEDILGKSGKIEKYCKKSISDVTDVTIDFMEGDIYAVAESKLYEITKNEAKEIATFKLDKVETIIYAIAVDANGTMYALGRNASKEALLFTVSISDKDANLKVVGKPENGGKVGGAVVDGAQALAFDLSTGELFWGAADYLRIIDTKKMQTFVVGDLGQKEGKQGTIKSLHCLTQMVEVGVTVAEGQESWGTASVDGSSTTGKKNQYVYESFLPGETVTITATAKEGYHFDHWEIEGDKKHTEYKPATLDIEAEDIVYVAYFAEGEGIESITIDPTKNVQKVLVDGVIYILRDGYIYTVTGEKVQ